MSHWKCLEVPSRSPAHTHTDIFSALWCPVRSLESPFAMKLSWKHPWNVETIFTAPFSVFFKTVTSRHEPAGFAKVINALGLPVNHGCWPGWYFMLCNFFLDKHISAIIWCVQNLLKRYKLHCEWRFWIRSGWTKSFWPNDQSDCCGWRLHFQMLPFSMSQYACP